MNDMSDEDAAVFDAHHKTLEKIRSTSKGARFLQVVELIAKDAAAEVADVASVLAPIALEIGKEALISFAQAALEKELSKLTK